MSAPLLSLPDERIARELTRAADIEAADRYWRSRIRSLLLLCYGLWIVGVAFFALSFHVEGRRVGEITFLIGFLIGYCGPLIAGYAFWVRHGE